MDGNEALLGFSWTWLPRTCHVLEDDLELPIFLPPPPECRNHKHVPPCMAIF